MDVHVSPKIERTPSIPSTMKEEDKHVEGDLHVLEILGHSSKFAETLFLYQQQRYLCDCVIVANNGYIPAHRLVLVAGSPFFQQLDSSRSYTSSFDANFTLESDLEDVKTIMRLLYTGKLLVNSQNIYRLHKICKFLQLSEASSLCEGYIQANCKTLEYGQENVESAVGYDMSKGVGDPSDKAHSIKSHRNHDQLVMLEGDENNTITIGKLENIPSIESRNSLISESIMNDTGYSYVIFPDESQKNENLGTNITVQGDENSQGSSSSSSTIVENPGTALKTEIHSEEENSDDGMKVEEEEQSAKVKRKVHTNTSKKRKREEVEQNITEVNKKPCPGIPYHLAKANDVLKNQKGGKLSCRACKLYFLNPQDMMHHRRDVHPNYNTEKRDKYMCDICFRKPNSILGVIEHKFKKHGIPYDTKKYPTIKCGYKNCKYSTIVEQIMRSHVKKSHSRKKSKKVEDSEDEEGEEEEEEGDADSRTSVCSNAKVESDDSTEIPFGNLFTSSVENTRSEKDVSDQSLQNDGKALSNASSMEENDSTEKKCPGIPYDEDKAHEVMKDRKIRKFSCRMCRLLFLDPKDLHQHRLDVHPSNNTKQREKYMCDICFRKPNTIVGVVEHKFKKHGIPYDEKKYPTIKCDFKKCKYTTISQHNMKSHIKKTHKGKTAAQVREANGENSGSSDCSSDSDDDFTNIPIGDMFISIGEDGEMICRKEKDTNATDQPSKKRQKRSKLENEQVKNLCPGIPYDDAPLHEVLSDPTVNRYSCRSCKLHFLKPQDLLHHRLTSHPSNKKKEKYTCEICFKKPNSIIALVEHKFKKHDIPYDVDQYPLLHCTYETCKFTTIVQQTLKDHVKKVHEQQQIFVCEVCGRESKSLAQHKYHAATHTRTGDEHVCNICGKSTMTMYSLKKHIEEVHQKKRKRYLCHFCPYGTYGTREFHNHLYKIHNEQPPEGREIFKCDKCDYFTLTRSYLERHELLHQGAERKFLCPTCNKGFYSMANLKVHERRHKAEPLKCEAEGCNFVTYYKHIMKNHVSGKHTNVALRPYKCHLCNHSCKLKGNLNKHLAGKHGLEVMTQVKQRKIALETGTGFKELLKTCAGARSRHLLKDLV